MKKVLLSAAALMIGSSLFAQHSLQKIWESDSLTLKSPESVLYDPSSNSLYVSSMGSGSVVRMDAEGKISNAEWVKGLKGNMGSALYAGVFYTAENGGITAIDTKTAAVTNRTPIEGAGMLNDVAIDAKGIVYVSDTRAGKVYKLENNKASVYQENLPGANGLLFVDDDLYIITSSAVHKVPAGKSIIKIADGFENGLDGIVMVAKDEFIISNYRGILYHLNKDGAKSVLLDTRGKRIMANDISYNSKSKILYVPSFGSNRIIAYQLK